MRFATGLGVLGLLVCVVARPIDAKPSHQAILPPFGHTHFCLRYPADCDQTPGRTLSSIPQASRWRQLNLIHTWINATISPRDADPGEFDTWSLFPAEGNCNDYAVTKRHILLQAGWPSSSLLLAEVTLVATGEHHLILIVRGIGGDWVLDNLRPDVVRLEETRRDYIWDRIESARDPRLWTKPVAGLI